VYKIDNFSHPAKSNNPVKTSA